MAMPHAGDRPPPLACLLFLEKEKKVYAFCWSQRQSGRQEGAGAWRLGGPVVVHLGRGGDGCGAMGPFEMLSGKQRELLACFEALELGEGEVPPSERVEVLLETLWLHVRLTERQLQPLVVRVEGHGRALQEAEILLAMHELMAELEWFPRGSLEWRARLLALEDVTVAHIRSLELQLFPRLSSALDEQEERELVRRLAATREALWLEMRRARPALPVLEHAESCLAH